ncbi:MAG: aminotransferase class I/II-fold pyridoxal phosphate-dependent enzyme, partial [Euryarchaeota archaeon]|nr:aminotransferase class I/II-fold pyridoxal phosphate-dependent enzyme [Euryarchaeota archaeon]
MQKELPPFPVARRAAQMEYAIRDVVLPARTLEAAGHKILKLNIGDPAPYDFPVPPHMVTALHAAAQAGANGYGDSEGDPGLRRAIAARETKRNGIDTDPKDVYVGTGVTEVLQLLLGATLSAGDELLLPGPSYPPYEGLTKYFDATPIEYRTDETDGWQPDIDDLRKKITPKTRAIALINPNNPTGALYSEKRLKEIADLAGEHQDQIFLISDEIYDDMALDAQHVATAAVAKDLPTVTLNGFSKIYLVPGWRLGHAIFRDPDGRLKLIRDGFERVARNRLCPSTIAQKAAIAALEGPQDHIAETKAKLIKRRDLVHKRLNEIPGITSAKPEGAFYIFPKIAAMEEGKGPWKSDKAFVLDLLETEKVLTVHGSGFGKTYGKDHFRVVFLATEDVLG